MARDWEDVQKKVFTRWMNSYAKKAGFKIENIEEDFEDGKKLVMFMEVIGGETLGRYNKNPRHKLQKIENLNIAVAYIKAKGIVLNNIGSEDIHNGNLKLIMGLIWMLILRFQVEDITEGELKAKEALLLWCQRKTEPYDNVDVQNFHRSWQDGLAFCALIHAHRPNLIDYGKLNADDPIGNLNYAFQVAEEHLDVDQLLDAEDIVNTAKPDERSVIAYVSALYHVFAGDKQTEDAARRIKNLVEFMNMVESMKDEFNGLASDLLEWMKEKIPYMEDRDYDGTLQHLTQLLDEMKAYKTDEKPDKEKEKAQLENILATLNLKLKNANRSAWEPEDELNLENLNGLWDTLMDEEDKREKWLRDQLNRQGKIDKALGRFNDKLAQLENWIDEKDEYLSKEETVNSLSDANNKLKKAEAFPKEYQRSEDRLNQVKDLCQELVDLGADDADDIQTRTNAAEEKWGGLGPKSDAKIADLTEKVALEKRKEELRNKWADDAAEYLKWAKATSNDVQSREFGDSLEAVEAFGEKLVESDAEIDSTNGEKVASLNDTWNELQELGVTKNPYSPYTIDDVNDADESLKKDQEDRKVAFDEELERQKEMEALRLKFAELADAFVQQLEDRAAAIDEAYGSGDGDLDATIEGLQGIWDEGNPEEAPLAELTEVANEMLKMGIRNNRHTKLTMPALTKLRKNFDASSRDKIQFLADEKDLKEEYLKKSEALAEWVAETLPTLEKEFDNTLAGAKKIYNEWNVYKSQESAENENDHSNLSSLMAKIVDFLEKNGRPEWDVSQDELDAQFVLLGEEEDKVEEAIRAELERQETLDGLKRRFELSFGALSDFVAAKEEELGTEEEISSLKGARLHVKLLRVAKREIKNKESRLATLLKLKAKLINLEYVNSDEVTAQCDDLEARWANLSELAEAKNEKLQESVGSENEKEQLRIAFANAARDWKRFVKQTDRQLSDHYFGETLDAVTESEPAVQAEIDGLNEKMGELKGAVDAAVSALAETGVEDNKHSDVTPEEIAESETEITQTIADYRGAFDAEVENQQNKDARRKEWADQAQELADWIDAQRDLLNAVEGDADEKIASINGIYGEQTVGQEKLDSVLGLLAEIEAEGIYGNNHTGLSGSILKGRIKKYDRFVSNYLSELENDKKVEERIAAAEAEAERRNAVEGLELQFEEKEDEIKDWIQDAQDRNTDDENITTVAGAEEALEAFNTFHSTSDATSALLEELNGIVAQLAELEVDRANPLNDLFTETMSECEVKKTALTEQIGYQQTQAEVLDGYDGEAQTVNTELDTVKEILHIGDASVDEAVAKASDAVSRLQGLKDNVVALEGKWGELDEDHRQNTLDFTELNSSYQALTENASTTKDNFVKEQLSKSESNISPEDLREFRETFDFFDKNGDGTLNALDFYGVLTALGETPTEISAKAVFDTIDTNGTGQIDFDEFSAFMIDRRKDSDSQSQLEESFAAMTGGASFITEDQLKFILPEDQLSQVLATMPVFNDEDGNPIGYDYRAWLSSAYN